MNLYESTMKNYLDIIDNTEKKDAIKKIQNELYINISSIKTLMKEYEKTQNTQYAHDSVEIYINDIMKKIKEIAKKSHSYYDVEYNEDDETFHLVQKSYSVEDLEWDVGDENGQTVMSLRMGQDKKITGISRNVEKKEDTGIQGPAIPSIKNISRKETTKHDSSDEDIFATKSSSTPSE